MSERRSVPVSAEEDSVRLDRWFARNFPSLPHGRLQRLLRTGQVRVDGKRARAGTRLLAGQRVRVPPEAHAAGADAPPERGVQPSRDEVDRLRARILFRDHDLVAIDKPAGLAVQGGTRQRRHLDALAGALQFDAREPPRLVHRLDKDTSGVLVMARHARSAAWLARLFRAGEAGKSYWAVVAGVPRPLDGVVEVPLRKAGTGRERVVEDAASGKSALTRYRTIARHRQRAAWLMLNPLTGRTHQLRVHCASLGTPIVGDGKYGGPSAGLATGPGEVARRLHLHARELVLPHPDGGNLRLRAPLPDHMHRTFDSLGFDADAPAAEADQGR